MVNVPCMDRSYGFCAYISSSKHHCFFFCRAQRAWRVFVRFFRSPKWKVDIFVYDMGVSKNRRTPNGWWKSWKTLLKWMIWGYHYFGKHPYDCRFVCNSIRLISWVIFVWWVKIWNYHISPFSWICLLECWANLRRITFLFWCKIEHKNLKSNSKWTLKTKNIPTSSLTF